METPEHLLELRTEIDQREAEHLRDMLDCQERIVNLLEALRFIMSQRPRTAYANKEGLRERLRNIFTTVAAAIAEEEKESTE